MGVGMQGIEKEGNDGKEGMWGMGWKSMESKNRDVNVGTRDGNMGNVRMQE